MWKYAIPLFVFALLVALLSIGLKLDPGHVPSPLIGKPAPEFSLPRLHQPESQLTLTEFKNRAVLLNVWASWCEACRAEHPLLLNIAASGVVPIYGLNYKDNRDDALAWLSHLGDPYESIAVDQTGRVGIDLGVYGAPESFIIDQNGIIVYKQIGMITAEIWQEKMLPLIQKLNSRQP